MKIMHTMEHAVKLHIKNIEAAPTSMDAAVAYIAIQPKALATELTRMIAANSGQR